MMEIYKEVLYSPCILATCGVAVIMLIVRGILWMVGVPFN
jgi:hypothetical protein